MSTQAMPAPDSPTQLSLARRPLRCDSARRHRWMLRRARTACEFSGRAIPMRRELEVVPPERVDGPGRTARGSSRVWLPATSKVTT